MLKNKIIKGEIKMSEKINGLLLRKESVRKKIVLSNGEVIKIFNPDQAKIDEFLDFQTRYFKNNMDVDGFDNRTVLFELIPMFTNLDFSELQDELMIEEFINNPSLELQEVREEIRGIMNKINTIRTNTLRNEFEGIDIKVQQIKIMKDIPQEAFDIINKDSKDLINDKTIANMQNIISLSEKMNAVDEENENKRREIEEYKKKIQELESGLNE